MKKSKKIKRKRLTTKLWKQRVNYKEKWEEQRYLRKIEVLTFYGKQGKLQCNWPDCGVTDIDMLSIDHILDNGAEERKLYGAGWQFYYSIVKRNFPAGYQTLCMNHQFKKRMLVLRQNQCKDFTG